VRARGEGKTVSWIEQKRIGNFVNLDRSTFDVRFG
jgi:hypothetical protein